MKNYEIQIDIVALIITVVLICCSFGLIFANIEEIKSNDNEENLIVKTAILEHIPDAEPNVVGTVQIIAETIPEEVKEVEEVEYFDVPLDEELQDYIFELCEEHNIEPALVIAMIEKESNYNASAIGDKGNSLGLMQIQPRWNQDRMDILDCQNLLDPFQNVAVGIDLLDELFSKGNSVEWVLMAYNGGQSYANRKISNGEVSTYAKTVLSNSKNLERGV